MARKKTQQEFITEIKEIHGDRYDYSLVDYVNTRTKVKIICPIHGIFEQTPKMHLLGQGCRLCYNDKLLDNKETFIKKSIIKHGGFYSYDRVEYVDALTCVIITCPEHGDFTQKPKNHLKGYGCKKCAGVMPHTTDTFIKESMIIHNNKYDYSLVKYINNKTSVSIICPSHGIFNQPPREHLSGHGCKKCADTEKSHKMKSNTEEFIIKSNKKHNDFYDYRNTLYIDVYTHVKITCPIHGEFSQTPRDHLNGHGCQRCNFSKGENKIIEYLDNYDIKYFKQMGFDNCKNERILKFDFYLPELNLCIEYDGIQHYKSIGYFGGEEAFLETQKRDKIKNEYCKNNNIHLIRIKYTDYNDIYDILSEKLSQCTFTL